MRIAVSSRGLRVQSARQFRRCGSEVIVNDACGNKKSAKHGPDAMLDVQRVKQRKMDPSLTQNGPHLLSRKVLDKGVDAGGRISSGFTSQYRLRISKARASSSDLASERFLPQDQCGNSTTVSISSPWRSQDSKMMYYRGGDNGGLVMQFQGCDAKNSAKSRMSRSDSDGEGRTPLFDVQLSPKRELRAAMLKTRFADTILRAKQKNVQDHGEKIDPAKLQKEKTRLEELQQKGDPKNARIETQIIAAEAASRLRAEAETIRRRQREREAARMALEQMEKTVDLDENLKFLKDLEVLSQSAFITAEGGRWRSPLEWLGLYLKDDFMEDEEEEAFLYGDREEGEIAFASGC